MDCPKIIDLHIPDKQSLFKSYMSFICGGGLFLPTHHAYSMGDELFMLLKLLDDPGEFAVVGKVVWITPAAAQNKRIRGIGLQFSENGDRLKIHIENLLSGTVEESAPTLTL